ncbi:MAG: TonB-dependent receptor [Bacteroidales bacterium]|nr:TonB-dependent receptor [Bacteroidales bacterium]
MVVRRVLILILAASFAGFAAAQKPDYKITWDYAGLKFSDFAERVEQETPLRFYFRDDWTSGLTMPALGENPLLTVLLDYAFAGHGIYYIIDDKGNIILTKDVMIRLARSEKEADDKYLAPDDYTDNGESTVLTGNLLYEIGNPSEKERSGNVSLTGYIKDKTSNEPLTGVTVFIKELARGSVTDGTGYYQINIPRGTYNIKFSFLGMKEVSLNARIYGSGRLDMEMAEDFIPIEGAVVTARRNDMLRRYEVGLEKVNMATFRLMPTTLGETDIFKNILLIPGIKTVGEASQGFNVRGGAADQNLILLYGAPLFNPSHFFGFFTSVNADIIKDLHLYKGGMPARYGGRLSSVIDIIPRDGSTGEFGGNAGISPVSAHLLLDVPLVKEKLSLLLSARSTYSDWLMSLVDDPVIKNSSASFYDINGRLTWKADEKNSFELSGYQSHDEFRLNSDTTYSYNNTIAALGWSHTVSDEMTMRLSANTSIYRYDIMSLGTPANAFSLDYRLNYASVRADFDWSPATLHNFNYGLEIINYNILPGDYQPASDSSLVVAKTIEREKALESAVYFEDKLNLSDNLSLSLGLRYSLFSSIGPKLIRLYEPGLPKSRATVYDTLMISDGKFYKTYSGPEYRLSLNYTVNSSSSVKLNYNRTRQYVHLLSNTTSISPTDIWKLSDYYLYPQVADQFSAGYYLAIPWNTLELSAEVYYKPIRNMIDFKGGAILTMNESIEKDIVNVNGRAYGIELMLKKVSGKATWHISYTYSRILLRSTSEFTSEAINGGAWFPASHDKPHDLGMSFNYALTRRWNIALSYVYNTGRPITYPVGMYQTGGQWLVQYSDRNEYRVPYYSRLDFSARLKGNLKSDKFMNPVWTFSCYNVLGRDNVYSEYFVVDGNTVSAYRLSVFANAIPTITYSFDF